MFRHKTNEQYMKWEREFHVYEHADTNDTNEWIDIERINEPAWQSRYDYESNIISHFINEIDMKTILEIGSGPGELSKYVHNKVNHLIEYDLVDKPLAKKAFIDLGYKGNFFVKDISHNLDLDGLKTSYDLIICNDCLEHLFSPSAIIQKFYHLISEDGFVFISNPNWRMGHWFIYRGLFDYDNFNYFMHVHGFNLKYSFPSPLQTMNIPKLDSESEMSSELHTSWNHYLIYQKRELSKN